MTAAEPPATLKVYRAAIGLCAPLAGLALRLRLSRGKEDEARLCERRGWASLPRPQGEVIWVHGASVGEMLSVLPLIEGIGARWPQTAILLTSGTVTSARLATERLPAGVLHQFVPLDVPAFLERFLDHWRPRLAIFAESELWPNTIMALKARGIRSALVNGRLSARSAARWRRLPATIAWLIGAFEICLAQGPGDGERLKSLGGHHVKVAGNLKLDVPAPGANAENLKALQASIGGRQVLIAASTHGGEETMLAEAHRQISARFPRLLTIIAPRHPERGAGIAEDLAGLGLRVKLRSKGQLPGKTTDIYIADTLGELGLIYRCGMVTFMGGSLIPHGGQNPIEPAKLSAAILHGPQVFNFAEIYQRLDAAGGAFAVASAAQLAQTATDLLDNPDAIARAAAQARLAVEAGGGALARTLDALAPLLAPERA